VAGYEGGKFLRELTSRDVKVSPADAARKDFQQRFARRGNRHRDVFEDERMVAKRSGSVQDGGAHGVS
jgi:hypothetical protein